MKKQFAIMAAVISLSLTQAHAQGYFNFQNGAPGVDAPIKEVGGTTFLVGSAYKADFYWGPANTADANALTAGGLAQSFDSIDAGYFYGPKVTLAGQTGTITVQVRAWRASDGATWADAAASGPNAHIGQGNLIQLTLGTGTLPTPNMIGIQSFNLTTGPEPATLALGLMGAGALFIRRRKAA